MAANKWITGVINLLLGIIILDLFLFGVFYGFDPMVFITLKKHTIFGIICFWFTFSKHRTCKALRIVGVYTPIITRWWFQIFLNPYLGK